MKWLTFIDVATCFLVNETCEINDEIFTLKNMKLLLSTNKVAGMFVQQLKKLFNNYFVPTRTNDNCLF